MEISEIHQKKNEGGTTFERALVENPIKTKGSARLQKRDSERSSLDETVKERTKVQKIR